MTIKTVGGTVHMFFDSIDELESETTRVSTPTNALILKRALANHDRNNSGRWYGTSSSARAKDYMRNGWPEMLVTLRAMLSGLHDQLDLAPSTARLRRRKRVRADYGDTLDIHRVWSGNLDKAWERPVSEHRVTATQRHATIYINVGSACNISASEAMWRGAAAMYISDLLQRDGIATEIHIGMTVLKPCGTLRGSRITGMLGAVKVKDYRSPLNEEVLAALVSVAFFRVHGFAMITALPDEIHPNFGYPANGGLTCNIQERKDAGELVVEINECTRREHAEAEIRKVIKHLKEETVSV